MIRVLTILFVALLTIPAFAQKVKIKNKTACINKTEFVKWDNSLRFSETCTVTHVKTENPLFSMKLYHYDKYDSVARKSIRKHYYNIRFLDFDDELQCSMTTKKFFKALYNSDIMNKDGTINEEKAKTFIRTYDEDVPIQVNING